MKHTIYPSTYSGSIMANPSKSLMQRAIAIALLTEGQTTLTNPCWSNDSKSALQMAKYLGAKVDASNGNVTIQGFSDSFQENVSVGESGLGIRCFIPIASLFDKKFTFTAEGSLKTRPLNMLIQPLRDLDVKIETNNGHAPVKVQGPIQGQHITLDGSISSQVLTGLLIALPKTKRDSSIKVSHLKSIPYIDLTLQIIKDFGVQITHQNYQHFKIKGNQEYQARQYKIEGDWSGMAFHLVGAAISGSIEISGLNLKSKQADRKILQALTDAGASIEMYNDRITVRKGELKAFTFDATHCPDLFPPLSNLAAQCKGTSIIKGVHRLIHKESNRALVIQSEWQKLGIDISIQGDDMHITGGEIRGNEIDSHNDHRIAMLGAIAALNSHGSITINNTQAVNKSYPLFFTHFKSLTNIKAI